MPEPSSHVPTAVIGRAAEDARLRKELEKLDNSYTDLKAAYAELRMKYQAVAQENMNLKDELGLYRGR